MSTAWTHLDHFSVLQQPSSCKGIPFHAQGPCQNPSKQSCHLVWSLPQGKESKPKKQVVKARKSNRKGTMALLQSQQPLWSRQFMKEDWTRCCLRPRPMHPALDHMVHVHMQMLLLKCQILERALHPSAAVSKRIWVGKSHFWHRRQPKRSYKLKRSSRCMKTCNICIKPAKKNWNVLEILLVPAAVSMLHHLHLCQKHLLWCHRANHFAMRLWDWWKSECKFLGGWRLVDTVWQRFPKGKFAMGMPGARWNFSLGCMQTAHMPIWSKKIQTFSMQFVSWKESWQRGTKSPVSWMRPRSCSRIWPRRLPRCMQCRKRVRGVFEKWRPPEGVKFL